MSENPYQAPATNLVDRPLLVGNNYAQLAIAAVLPAGAAAWALTTVPQFAAVYTQFEADLPLGTRVLLATYRWWGLIAVTIVATWVLGERSRLKQRVVLSLGIVSGIALFFFGVWACYTPIFELAKKV